MRWTWMLCGVVLSGLTLPVGAQVPDEKKPDPPSSTVPAHPEKPEHAPDHEDDELLPRTAEDWREALRMPVSLKLEDQSIRGAVEQICEVHQVPVSWDRLRHSVSNQEADFNLDLLDDNRVSMRFDAVSGASALRRVLETAKLCWSCEDWGVEIATLEQHKNKFSNRIYDVTDLISPKPKHEPPHIDYSTPPPPPADSKGDEKTSRPEPSSLKKIQFGSEQPPTPPQESLSSTCLLTPLSVSQRESQKDDLKTAIMQAFGTEQGILWRDIDGEGGTLSLVETSAATLLVIRQTEWCHYEIENLLNELILFHHSREELEDGEIELEVRPKTAARHPIVVRHLPVRRVIRK